MLDRQSGCQIEKLEPNSAIQRVHNFVTLLTLWVRKSETRLFFLLGLRIAVNMPAK